MTGVFSDFNHEMQFMGVHEGAVGVIRNILVWLKNLSGEWEVLMTSHNNSIKNIVLQ